MVSAIGNSQESVGVDMVKRVSGWFREEVLGECLSESMMGIEEFMLSLLKGMRNTTYTLHTRDSSPKNSKDGKPDTADDSPESS